jgi:2-phospho-L-lactate guanylyltransferase
MTTARRAPWSIIVPVKPALLGKSRLDVSLLGAGSIDRVELVRAIAIDTVRAAAAAARVADVVVVTDDAPLTRGVESLPRVRVVAEEGARGLAGAIERGAASIDPARPRAVLLGDLPALRPSDLDAALMLAAARSRGVVADAEGTGSTLVTASVGVDLATAFGADSYARHLALGCAALPIDHQSTLRRDVDTAAHLARAAEFGLGEHTAGLLARAAAA